jgi:predicted glycoside hydrolase/deacetylase ChbG (UPF0249 family)
MPDENENVESAEDEQTPLLPSANQAARADNSQAGEQRQDLSHLDAHHRYHFPGVCGHTIANISAGHDLAVRLVAKSPVRI